MSAEPAIHIPTWTTEHTVSTPGRFAGWKIVRSNYGVFIDGVTKPSRIYVIDHRDNRMRDVTELLPKLR